MMTWFAICVEKEIDFFFVQGRKLLFQQFDEIVVHTTFNCTRSPGNVDSVSHVECHINLSLVKANPKVALCRLHGGGGTS